ncbi:MAG: DEAD/DEAH box helicase [Candidatus Micrarchaeota archaeon]|nr:DEAD/DEAH box helicase [Candidatus Micrarchaeota archaeon]
MKFEDMEFSASIKEALSSMNYTTPTKVQERVIPVMCNGSNVIVRSHTGSGKTLAFGIPLSDRIITRKSRAALVLGPTRELVMQVKSELRQVNRFTGLRIFEVYGGHGIEGETQVLRGRVDILCATPGRLLDHIERGNIDMEMFDTVVLDEADRMLDMGFIDDIRKILEMVKPRWTHLFSATLDGKVAVLIQEYIARYEEILLEEEIIGTNIIEKKFIVPRQQKFKELYKYIQQAGRQRVLVFVSTKRYAEMLRERLCNRGVRAVSLHGDLSQQKREHSLEMFRSGKSNVLIATDVAARGLQIDNVEYVINYDEAADADTHRHRIGRTGRMGATGYAITFIDENPIQRGPYGASNPKAGEPRSYRGVREVKSMQFYIDRGY